MSIDGLRRFFRLPPRAPRHAADDVDEELRFHLDMRAQELAASGLDPRAARAAALREFGDLEGTRRDLAARDAGALRTTRRAERLDELRQDLRFAVRQLRRAPAHAAASIATLAIGVGATTAIFSVVDGVLLRPLPYPDADRLVMLWQRDVEAGTRDDLSPANFLDVRERARSFDALAGIEPYGLDWQGPEGPETLRSWLVTEGFFSILGTPARLGRTLRPDDFVSGRHRVAVLSDAVWRVRFGADPTVVGRAISLDGEPFTIVGVMPPDFRFPAGRDVWHPKIFDPGDRERRGANYYWAVGRLRDDVSPETAAREVASIASRLAEEYPRTNATTTLTVVPLAEELLGRARPALLLLLATVTLVLLVACANVASLVLARAVRRERELAVRAALGAGRARLARQLVTEGVVLAAAGGTLGVLFATWGVRLIRAASPATLPRADEMAVDVRVLVFAVGVSLLAALLAGVAPALLAARPRLHDALRSGGRGSTAGRAGVRLRGALVVGEIALAVVLVAGAALLARSFVALLSEDRGWRAGNVLAVTVQAWSYAPTPERRAAFVREATARIASLPGVRAVGATSSLPLAEAIGADEAGLAIEGRHVVGRDELPNVHATAATAGYFEALGIPLRRGRSFAPTDAAGTTPVALVDESLARRYWPDEDPIGKRITLRFSGPPVAREIVGIVGDVRHEGLDHAPEPGVYLPHAQAPTGAITFVVRTAADPLGAAGAVRREIAALLPALPISSATTLELLLDDSLRERRFSLLLLGIFSLTALALAAVGTYGVLAQATSERTAEIGVRMALGARAMDVVALVVRQGGALALTGVVLGLGGAVALGRAMRGMLYGVAPTDPVAVGGAAAALLVVAAAACWLPARRATEVEPVEALRGE